MDVAQSATISATQGVHPPPPAIRTESADSGSVGRGGGGFMAAFMGSPSPEGKRKLMEDMSKMVDQQLEEEEQDAEGSDYSESDAVDGALQMTHIAPSSLSVAHSQVPVQSTSTSTRQTSPPDSNSFDYSYARAGSSHSSRSPSPPEPL
ncbi:hypothetical protein P7C70_g9106, partial [Phenoliferia sp. Uapishka_3]